MTTFQKLSLEGSKLTFIVTMEDGASETCVYMLDGNEKEDDLMARVALHMESEKQRQDFLVGEEVSPVMEVSRDGSGKVHIKARDGKAVEVPEELPVAPRAKKAKV